MARFLTWGLPLGVVRGWPGLESSESSPGLAVTLHVWCWDRDGWNSSGPTGHLSPCGLCAWQVWASSLHSGFRLQGSLSWWLASPRVSILRDRKWNRLDLITDQSSHVPPTPLTQGEATETPSLHTKRVKESVSIFNCLQSHKAHVVFLFWRGYFDIGAAHFDVSSYPSLKPHRCVALWPCLMCLGGVAAGILRSRRIR